MWPQTLHAPPLPELVLISSSRTVGKSLESDNNLERVPTNRVAQNKSFSAYVAIVKLKRLSISTRRIERDSYLLAKLRHYQFSGLLVCKARQNKSFNYSTITLTTCYDTYYCR